MKTAIDVDFFEPERPTDINRGRLYIDDNGKDYIEYRVEGIGHFRLINVIFATAIDSDEKYSLVNCVFRQSNGSFCRYLINELYKGNHITKALDNNCIEVEARMTGLTNWLNKPRIIAELTFSDSDESNIKIKNSFQEVFQISENIKLEFSEYCRFNFDRNETILRNKSSVRFKCVQPVSRVELHRNLLALAGLLSIFTDEPVKLIKESFLFSTEKTLEHVSVRELRGKDEYENEALLTYDKIEPNWQNVMNIFYVEGDKFKKVIDLFIASIENTTAEISFLNITTSFEVFHKEFLEEENDTIREDLFKELKEAGLVSRDTKKWDQIIRYWHLMKLTAHIDFFKQNLKTPKKQFPC